MLIDLTCPAEIFRTAPPTDKIPAATLTLFNLSDRVIASVEVSLRLLDGDGEETERLAFRGRALNGRPHSTFLLTVPCAPSPLLKSIDATIEKVWFADNDTWRRNPADAVEYTPNALPVSPALTKLKYAAGETAVGFPVMQENLWVCVCGRPNPRNSDCCARCGQQADTVFSRFTQEAVEAQISLKERQLDLNSRNTREDTIRLQRLREEEYRERKNRRGSRIRIAIALAAALALAAGTMLYAAPGLRLLEGRRALAAGDAEGAKTIFESLGSFGNAEALKSECEWQLALQAVDTEDRTAESLAEASALLRSISGKPEAIEKADETDLLRSRLLLAEGRWEEALEALTALPEDNAARAELERDCRMAQARELQRNKDYAGARKIYLSLGDYPGAREQAANCLYEPAKVLMLQQDWDGAIEILSQIPDYLDSRSLTLECHYHKAEALEEEGNIERASAEFLLAGNWGDAVDRSRKLTYDAAAALYAAGDLRGAQSLYAAIPDYQDANDMDRKCRYELAAEAVGDREFTLALELLKDIPDDYERTKALRSEAVYEKAKTAVRQEAWAEAAELLGSLDRPALRSKYKDIETLYLKACQEAGIEPYPAEPEDEADASADGETASDGTDASADGGTAPGEADAPDGNGSAPDETAASTEAGAVPGEEDGTADAGTPAGEAEPSAEGETADTPADSAFLVTEDDQP